MNARLVNSYDIYILYSIVSAYFLKHVFVQQPIEI